MMYIISTAHIWCNGTLLHKSSVGGGGWEIIHILVLECNLIHVYSHLIFICSTIVSAGT